MFYSAVRRARLGKSDADTRIPLGAASLDESGPRRRVFGRVIVGEDSDEPMDLDSPRSRRAPTHYCRPFLHG
jgi:hypothetical protein